MTSLASKLYAQRMARADWAAEAAQLATSGRASDEYARIARGWRYAAERAAGGDCRPIGTSREARP